MTDEARRTAALLAMWDRFPAVAERVRRVYGLRLPRHLAVFCAFWASAAGDEREALADLMAAPFGLTEYFRDGGLDRVGLDGLDERLHGRYRRDPAEFVTALGGGSDGAHYGLWYDDPAELPSLVAVNWARDSAETWTHGSATLREELNRLVRKALRDYQDEPEEEESRQRLRALLGALDWFADADREAMAADGERRWAASAGRRRTAVSIYPGVDAAAGDPCLGESDARLRAFRADASEAGGWIGRAERELVAGQPALALAVGGELHWLDRDEYRRAGHDLLVGAYRALGRHALAEIAEVHAAHRDLRSVDVLVRPADPAPRPGQAGG